MKTYIEIREPMASADRVLEMWPGISAHELADIIDADLFENVPTAYHVHKIISDGKGVTIAKCTRCETRGNYFVHGQDCYDFTGIAFTLAEIFEYGQRNPQVFYRTVENIDGAWADANLPGIIGQIQIEDAPFPMVAVDTSALEPQLAEAQKKIEDVEGVRRWNKLFLTERAELQKSLEDKDARIAELEQELAAGADAEGRAGPDAAPRTQTATDARQEKVLARWKDAFKTMLKVALQCQKDGPKKRTAPDIQAMCSKHGKELSRAQLAFLKECLKDCLGEEHVNTEGGASLQ